jgi:hypothetical protein
MRVFWDRWAWLFLALCVVAAGVSSWLYGDDHQHYDGWFVALGWVFMLFAWYLCQARPSAARIATGFRKHKAALFTSAIAVVLLYTYIGDIAIYVMPTAIYGYARKYGIAWVRVTIAQRPHDCEWDSAPLGSKHCHYESQVGTVKTGISTDGVTALVSYDDGKTWSVNTEHVEPAVFVSWNKVED